jgi:hypothetical protein
MNLRSDHFVIDSQVSILEWCLSGFYWHWECLPTKLYSAMQFEMCDRNLKSGCLEQVVFKGLVLVSGIFVWMFISQLVMVMSHSTRSLVPLNTTGCISNKIHQVMHLLLGKLWSMVCHYIYSNLHCRLKSNAFGWYSSGVIPLVNCGLKSEYWLTCEQQLKHIRSVFSPKDPCKIFFAPWYNIVIE